MPNATSTSTVATSSFNRNNFVGFASSTAIGGATSTATSSRFRGSGARTFGTTGTTQATTAVTATVHAVPVVVGISNDTSTEIISGLNEGDTIVVRTVSGGTSATAAASTARTGSIFGIGGGGGGAGGPPPKQ